MDEASMTVERAGTGHASDHAHVHGGGSSASSVPACEGSASGPTATVDMYRRVGELTRSLHEALRELGYERNIEMAAQSLPDARERLAYIATLTGRAAERVLGAVERGQAVQEALAETAQALLERGGHRVIGPGEAPEDDTSSFLRRVIAATEEQQGLLHEIMMAQDFHDLTGQVIKRVGEIAHDLETNLVQLLLETAPMAAATAEPTGLSGPAMTPELRTDVVQSQGEVDALLDSLGF